MLKTLPFKHFWFWMFLLPASPYFYLAHSLKKYWTIKFFTVNMNENDVFFSVSDTGLLGKRKSECSYQESNPKTFRSLVRMLYHRATGDSWELRPFTRLKIYHHIYFIAQMPLIDIQILAVCRMFVP